MSFNKIYPNRKDWRKPYTGAKTIDKDCRVHGSCQICRGNRMLATMKALAAANDELWHDWPDEFWRPAMCWFLRRSVWRVPRT